MRRIILFTAGCLAIAVSLPFIYGQRLDARNTVPDTITACYLNTTAYNRYTRQPMHIENLIAIIRKIEQKTNGQWDARRISRTLVHRYMFDGMQFIRDRKPEFQYNQKPEERAKSIMIKELIPISAEEQLPDYILDNDEKCALHWMLSHSMNATMRDDEELGSSYPGYNGYNGGSNTGGSNPFNSNPNGNSNNNNNNGYPNNGSPNLGNNYYRGKREISNSSAEEEKDEFDWVSDNRPDSDKQAMKDEQNKENDDDDFEASVEKSSALGKGDDEQGSVKDNKSSEETELNLPHDSDVDFLPNVNGVLDTSSKSGRQVVDFRKRTRRPVETGVVYTNYGAVSAGRLISGIAAGLEPLSMGVNGGAAYSPGSSYGGSNSWNSGSGVGNANNGYNTPWKSMNGNGVQQPQNPGQPQTGGQRWGGRRKKRQAQNLQPLESLYAATLAGDAGQAAILNAVNNIPISALPSGRFNDSVCPREYILSEHPDPNREIYKDSAAWTYLTEAEVRGGLDGIILGSNIRRWDTNSNNLRLSDILEQYYSDLGIAGEPIFRSCDRSSLMSQSVDAGKLREQTKSFAFLYNNRTNEISDQKIIADPNAFERLIEESYQRMYGAASSFSSAGPGCERRLPSGTDNNDNAKYIVPKLTVYGVLDHSATIPEIDEQKRFLGQLAYELNVSPRGSRLGVVDGNSGSVIISPNWTDTSSILACRILGLNSRKPMTQTREANAFFPYIRLIYGKYVYAALVCAQSKTQDYSRVLTNLKSELIRVKNQELQYNYTNENGIVILLMVQGRRLESNQKAEIIRLRDEINNDREVGNDISLVVSSSKYADSDFEDLKFIRIQSNQNISAAAGTFAASLLRNTHGSLNYLQCDGNKYDQQAEHTIPTNLFISPGTIEYYKISPNYFFSSRALVLRFTSDNGKVRVCMSRREWYPNQSNEGNPGVECKETSGIYKPPGSSEVDVEFRNGLKKPCSKYKAATCDPIYISITPTEFARPGEGSMDCSVEGCQSSNQVKVTFTHWDMRCSGAMRTILSSSLAVIAASLVLLNWFKVS